MTGRRKEEEEEEEEEKEVIWYIKINRNDACFVS